MHDSWRDSLRDSFFYVGLFRAFDFTRGANTKFREAREVKHKISNSLEHGGDITGREASPIYKRTLDREWNAVVLSGALALYDM